MIKSKIIYILCSIVHHILQFFGFCSASSSESKDESEEQ